MSWHFFWCFFVTPVFTVSRERAIQGQAVYAGAVLGPYDFLPPSLQGVEKRNAFNASVPEKNDPRISPEKVEGDALKPQARFAQAGGSRLAAALDKEKDKSVRRADQDIVFGMSDYGFYLYQVDFSDLKRAAAREDLSRYIVFQVFLDKTGRVVKSRKESGSGDPFLDLFIQGKINNAVFKPGVAPRERWVTVRFVLR